MYKFQVVEWNGWTGPWHTTVDHIEDVYRIKPMILTAHWCGPAIARFQVRTAKKRATIIRILKRHFKNVVVEKL